MNHIDLKDSKFRLPSLGIPYDQEKYKFIGGDSVMLRPITAGAIRHLVGDRGAYKSYFSMLHHSLVEPKIPIDEMILTDVLAALVALKIMSTGPDYPIVFTCKDCEETTNVTVGLYEYGVKYADEIEDFKAEGIELKAGDSTLYLHLPTLGDEKALEEHLALVNSTPELLTDTPDIDENYTRLVQYIDKIDDKDYRPVLNDIKGNKRRFIDKFKALDETPAGTPEAISRTLSAYDIGVQPKKTLVCQNEDCGAENEVLLVISPDMFLSY